MNIRALQAPTLYGILLPVLLLVLVMAVNVGPVNIDLGKAMQDWFNDQITIESLILFDIRFPRSLLAMLIGATLGMAGASLQGLLRNPLAEPGIIGVSNGAALGAMIALAFYVTAKLAQKPSWPAYAMLGLAFGLGMLAKWNFAMLAIGLPLACLLQPNLRHLVLTPKIMAAIGDLTERGAR